MGSLTCTVILVPAVDATLAHTTHAHTLQLNSVGCVIIKAVYHLMSCVGNDGSVT